MKYLIIVGDGMADFKRGDLGGLTPLQYAQTPNMDRLASMGTIGLVKTVPDGLVPGSDVANLSVMGYDPTVYYTGRAPLEAAGMGVKLNENDVAFRCNLVTLSEEPSFEDKTMLDYSAGEIESDRAAKLIRDLEQHLKLKEMSFYPGVSFRHLMVWRGGPTGAFLTPPHDTTGKKIATFLPRGDGSDVLLSLMKESHPFLAAHPANTGNPAARPANAVWLWGQGKRPSLAKFGVRFGLSGAVISAVDLIKGIGICAGMEVVEVEGATGNIHSNFAGKVAAAVEVLKKGADLVYVHIEAPDEAGHQGNTELKVRAIEKIDRQVLGPLMEQMKEFAPYKIMLLPDHPTPLSVMTHTSDPVPFVVFDSRQPHDHPGATYCEEAASKGVFVERGYHLMALFVKTKPGARPSPEVVNML